MCIGALCMCLKSPWNNTIHLSNLPQCRDSFHRDGDHSRVFFRRRRVTPDPLPCPEAINTTLPPPPPPSCSGQPGIQRTPPPRVTHVSPFNLSAAGKHHWWVNIGNMRRSGPCFHPSSPNCTSVDIRGGPVGNKCPPSRDTLRGVRGKIARILET